MHVVRKLGPIVGLTATFAALAAALHFLPAGTFNTQIGRVLRESNAADLRRLPRVDVSPTRAMQASEAKVLPSPEVAADVRQYQRISATSDQDGLMLLPPDQSNVHTTSEEMANLRVAQYSADDRSAGMELNRAATAFAGVDELPNMETPMLDTPRAADHHRNQEPPAAAANRREDRSSSRPAMVGRSPSEADIAAASSRKVWDEDWDDELWGTKLDFQIWDVAAISSPLLKSPVQNAHTLDELIIQALQRSPNVQIFSEQPLIEETRIAEELAVFDWTGFINALWNDSNVPVGSLLQGATGRLLEEEWTSQAGARRRNAVGGEFEFSQSLGGFDSNSSFLTPPNQGNARLQFMYRHPLMRGAGRPVNLSRVVQAQINTDISLSDFARDTQDFLFQIISAYWKLYLDRGVLVQKLRTLEHAQGILNQVQTRGDIDAQRDQIFRVRAAIEDRRADALVAEKQVRDSQEALARLVWGGETPVASTVELIPLEHPFWNHQPIDFGQHVQLAVRYRPEIEVAIKNIQSASVDTAVARNQLLPRLDMIMTTYLSGLRGDRDSLNAWLDQFNKGDPSYAVGLSYEFPAYNRAAVSKHRRSLLQLRQLESSFRKAISDVTLEVGNAVRDVDLQRRSLLVRERSVELGKKELGSLASRRRKLAEQDRSMSLFLEAELNSQDRLEQAALSLLETQTQVMVAQAALWRATGTLIQAKQVSTHLMPEGGTPRIALDKPTGGPPVVVHYGPEEIQAQLVGDNSIYSVRPAPNPASMDGFIVAPDLPATSEATVPFGAEYPTADMGPNR